METSSFAFCNARNIDVLIKFANLSMIATPLSCKDERDGQLHSSEENPHRTLRIRNIVAMVCTFANLQILQIALRATELV